MNELNIESNKIICCRNSIENILSNAIKYTFESTTIELIVEDNSKNIQIYIRDEGPGLSKEDQKSLFLPYKKLTPHLAHNDHSSGLGLSIAKKYAEMLNSQIVCESELGRGSIFTLTLPKKNG